jgi:hypothetical protein
MSEGFFIDRLSAFELNSLLGSHPFNFERNDTNETELKLIYELIDTPRKLLHFKKAFERRSYLIKEINVIDIIIISAIEACAANLFSEIMSNLSILESDYRGTDMLKNTKAENFIEKHKADSPDNKAVDLLSLSLGNKNRNIKSIWLNIHSRAGVFGYGKFTTIDGHLLKISTPIKSSEAIAAIKEFLVKGDILKERQVEYIIDELNKSITDIDNESDFKEYSIAILSSIEGLLSSNAFMAYRIIYSVCSGLTHIPDINNKYKFITELYKNSQIPIITIHALHRVLVENSGAYFGLTDFRLTDDQASSLNKIFVARLDSYLATIPSIDLDESLLQLIFSYKQAGGDSTKILITVLNENNFIKFIYAICYIKAPHAMHLKENWHAELNYFIDDKTLLDIYKNFRKVDNVDINVKAVIENLLLKP